MHGSRRSLRRQRKGNSVWDMLGTDSSRRRRRSERHISIKVPETAKFTNMMIQHWQIEAKITNIMMQNRVRPR